MSEKNEQTGGRSIEQTSRSGTKQRKRSYPSGGTYTSLCQVIEACGRNGVRRIELGNGVSIDFGLDFAQQHSANDFIDYSPKVVDNRNVHSPIAPESVRLDDKMQMEMELEDLALTNPIAYEQLIIDRLAEGVTHD